VDIELEDIIKRRDYRLKYVWGCYICHPAKLWDYVTIHLFRTTDEIEAGTSNIKQQCLKKHITKPFKICTKCARTYEIEDSKCSNCEHHVIKKARLEVTIERADKEINRLKSQRKKRKINDIEFAQLVKDTGELIEHTKRELYNLE